MELLKDNGIAISMDSRGRALDDIFIERLYKTIGSLTMDVEFLKKKLSL